MRTSLRPLVLTLGLVVSTLPLAGQGYDTAALTKYRADHEASLKTDTGWLTVAGLHFLKQGENGSFLLWYHAEHAPHPESRVTLTEHVDNLGLPLMKVDLRYSAGDVEAVVKAHRVLDAELKARGLGSLAFLVDEASLPGRVLEQALDGYHQMGTTRMGTDPRTSVVDPECQVHGVRNLHVASSSVFPTSGQANPTLLATALAVRLANRIATRLNA